MNVNNPVGSLIDFGRDVIDKIWPDKTAQAAERAQAEGHVLDLAQQRYQTAVQASASTDAAQAEVNKVEAASPSLL
ncbi:MAG TPA: 3TM-type holin, partial [Candidatus Saccharimonadales bacterium]|nr:3TM-type holin [Candidatus Saccharimonadales bacterium]